MISCPSLDKLSALEAPLVSRARPLRWGVIGLGSAGRSKLKALSALSEHAQLVAVASRRPLDELRALDQLHALFEGGVELEPSWERLLERGDLDAVAICSESALHVEQARASLQAHHHTLVDFPLAPTLAQLDELYALARAQGRLLHQELIGALTPSHLALMALVEPDDPIETLEVSFTGGLSWWVEREWREGRAPLLALARLQRAWALLGPLKLERAALTTLGGEGGGGEGGEGEGGEGEGGESGGYELTLSARAPHHAHLQLTERRAPVSARHTSLKAFTRSGGALHELIGEPKRARLPLFELDVRSFYQQLSQLERGETPTPYVPLEEQRGLMSFIDEVSEALHAQLKGPTAHP